jgi:hypothetical protein
MSRIRPLRFTADIGKNHVPAATDEMVRHALSPAEPGDAVDIAFGDRFEHEHGTDWPAALAELVGALRDVRVSAEPLGIFGIGPIPLLMALGSLLGDKRSDLVFDRHRHLAESDPSRTWTWEPDGQELAWLPPTLPAFQRGAVDVAVLLSISGTIDRGAVAAVLPNSHPVYEIRLADPRVNAIRTRAHLRVFVEQWRAVLEDIQRHYGPEVRVHVFPAVPVSVAVECGRRLLQVSPTLRIHNNRGGVFEHALTISSGGVRAVARDSAASNTYGLSMEGRHGVFVSYSHDTPAHKESVLQMAVALRERGIDVLIDQFEPSPSRGWPTWMHQQIEDAEFVLVVCTKTYRERAEGRATPGTGLGASYEGSIINQTIYAQSGHNEKFIPLLLSGVPEDIPVFLRPYTYYRYPGELERLLRHLTRQPEIVPPPLGPRPVLPPRELGPDTDASE